MAMERGSRSVTPEWVRSHLAKSGDTMTTVHATNAAQKKLDAEGVANRIIKGKRGVPHEKLAKEFTLQAAHEEHTHRGQMHARRVGIKERELAALHKQGGMSEDHPTLKAAHKNLSDAVKGLAAHHAKDHPPASTHPHVKEIMKSASFGPKQRMDTAKHYAEQHGSRVGKKKAHGPLIRGKRGGMYYKLPGGSKQYAYAGNEGSHWAGEV